MEPIVTVNMQNTSNEARRILSTGLSLLSHRDNVPVFLTDSAYADMMMELMKLVIEQNRSINLTTITKPEEFVRHHLIDSLACVGLPELSSAKTIVDVGSGAGFPGLPLAALFPEKNFILMDSVRKKVDFISKTAAVLGIENVQALHLRAETAGQDPALRESFDLALCRSVGKLPLIMEYCFPLVKVGGATVFYKTEQAEKEIEESVTARKLLGGNGRIRIETCKDILPDSSHILYVLVKEQKTPKAYPRREGVPLKAPL